jgi:hypothetical protein
VGIDFFRRLAPDQARIFEVADQLLLLGIHTDDRLLRLQVLRALQLDVAKLLIAIRMSGTGRLFDIGAQTIAVFAQDATDHRLADPMPLVFQPLAQITQAKVEPLLLTHGITSRVRRHEREDQRFEGRIFFSAAGRPAPCRRRRSTGNPLTRRTVRAGRAEWCCAPGLYKECADDPKHGSSAHSNRTPRWCLNVSECRMLRCQQGFPRLDDRLLQRQFCSLVPG